MVKVEDRSPGRFVPFALQMYEADWLTNSADTYFGGGMSGRKGGTGTEIYQGVEYDLTTGRRVAYYLADPSGYQTKVTRIPAERVIHGFEVLRPGQLRGVSVFAPAVLLAHDLSDYMDAEIDAVKMAAKYLGFVKTPDIELFQRSRSAWNADSSQKIEEMENAIIEYLRPGEEIQLAKQERPADSFEPFTKFVLRLISISTGISYELLAGDYSGLNYSVLRGIRNDLIKEFAPHQERHARQFCRRIFRAVMDSMAITGRLTLPGYWSNPALYLRAQWMATGMPAVDPYKEGRADADAVNSLQKSPQEIAAARGRDYEEILDEIAEARAMQEERGLMVEQAAGSMKTNPAAIAEEGQEDEPTEDDRAAGQPAARGKPNLSVL